MHVYFVRHGETDLNVRHVHQSPSTPLNDNGFDQARSASEYLRAVNADHLLSSTYERALQTARTIGAAIGILPVRMDIFREVERPSNLANTSLYGMRSLWYIGMSVLYRNAPTWRYRDAENFTDIYARVRTAFAYIESLTEEHKSVIVVSHSVFINLMIMYMCHNRTLTLGDLVKTLGNVNELRNCAVTHVEYVGPAYGNTCAWQVASV
jgi:broad specificity phosphatase PhoE